MEDIRDIKIKREMGRNYIVVSAKEEWQETIPAKMLQNNEIDGILPFECRHIDNKFYYYYPMTFLKSVEANYNIKSVDFESLYKIYADIVEILKRGEIYFLPENGFIFEKEWMFWDDVNQKIFLCYIPGLQNNIWEDIKKFTEYMMQIMDNKDRNAAKFLYQVYDELSDDSFLSGGNGIVSSAGERLASAVSSFSTSKSFLKDSENRSYNQSKAVYKNGIMKRGDVVYALKPCSHALRNDFMRQWGTDYYLLEKPEGFGVEITIGRDTDCSMALPFSSISRMHAALCYSGGGLYISDKVSSNGTYVNSKRIAAGKKTPLKLQDRITFADIHFTLTDVSAIEK